VELFSVSEEFVFKYRKKQYIDSDDESAPNVTTVNNEPVSNDKLIPINQSVLG
jgi:hypothetical protein